MAKMQLHGICLVKDEADIVGYFLDRSLEQFDRIYVYDNGSNDGTWETVRQRAAEDARIVPFKSRAKPFRDSLRGEVFRQFRDRVRPGDWWCRLDVDEFYVDDPRAFLSLVPASHHVVWSVHFNYYRTEAELAAIPPGTGGRPPRFDGSFAQIGRAHV